MKELPAARSRYECKYLVPDSARAEILRSIRPFVRPDRFAAHSGGVYPICSLYLDSADLCLLEMGLRGLSERFKLRVRSYSDRPEESVFLEIKRRLNGIVHKRRARVDRAAALAFLRARCAGTGLRPPGSGAALEEFMGLTLGHAARPVLRVKYLREAYEGRSASPVRITFDTEIQYAWSRAPELDLAAGPWQPLPMAGTVLELKFTDACPAWTRDLVARFELERRSVSKYTLAMCKALEEVTPPGGMDARLRRGA